MSQAPVWTLRRSIRLPENVRAYAGRRMQGSWNNDAAHYRCGKVGCLAAGMTAGADSLDDMDLLRHGAMPALPLLPGRDVLAFVVMDSMQRRVYGRKKQDAAFGHTKIRGNRATARLSPAGVLIPGLRPVSALAAR
jgi:hypothetical protein